ncbi:spore germination protein KA [Hydrogenispora ethanolica]|uniref:Spore germination protein KA n=1 Tax=Hydrogenispora ethanolica TaxID=1082276 RepID=A0A4R1RGY9_HYDET|nr:spore germination protein [Hydrogenispora ethanolica]TCL65303.1 spore germination protein KA [Hydrogenispora ethanolica]
MKFSAFFGRLFQFHRKDQRFSLGNQSFERPPLPKKEPGAELSRDLAENEAQLKEIFGLPTNMDVVIRDFEIPALNRKALIIYIDGLSDRNTQNFAILEPLMVLGHDESGDSGDVIERVYQKLLPGHQIQRTKKRQDVIFGVLDGSSALLVDGGNEALIIETKGWEHRGIEKPSNEPVVRGPQESFNENFRANTASIRRYIRDPKLYTEILRVGKRSNNLLGMMYIEDIANPKLVEEVKYRIQTIAETVDYIPETGMLEEFLEDHPKSLVPQMLSTERPDRVAAYLREGHVALLMANSPFSLVVPITFTIFLHAAEDYYLRWPFGNFLRLIRSGAIFIALLLPAIYIGVVNYHQEMIPTDLLLAMTAAREAVPFPAFVEIIFMEFAFELIREAGVRIPSVIGPTIGIVGALILGQAAVSASIVSPILIIIIAITALASFVVPNYNASFTIRISRFIFVVLAAVLGFFGIAFGVFVLALHLASINSFGVPFLTPIAPYRPKNKDRVLRPRSYAQPYRPVFLRPLDAIRQKWNARPWDRPQADHSEEEDDHDS